MDQKSIIGAKWSRQSTLAYQECANFTISYLYELILESLWWKFDQHATKAAGQIQHFESIRLVPALHRKRMLTTKQFRRISLHKWSWCVKNTLALLGGPHTSLTFSSLSHPLPDKSTQPPPAKKCRCAVPGCDGTGHRNPTHWNDGHTTKAGCPLMDYIMLCVCIYVFIAVFNKYCDASTWLSKCMFACLYMNKHLTWARQGLLPVRFQSTEILTGLVTLL